MKTLSGQELSEFLSLILRHKPEILHLGMDAYGYANIEEIIRNGENNGLVITETEIRNVVLSSDKQRFKITGSSIKAVQGHSFEIIIEEQSQKPPQFLYHGTKFKLKEIILQQGLLGMKRNFVHLYSNYYAAFMANNSVKKEPLVFEINAGEMYRDGHEFYLPDNNVWQTKTVPSKYMTIKSPHEIDRLKKITITKTSSFTKINNTVIVLNSKFNAQASIYVQNCYLCESKRALYSFDDGRLMCRELTYEQPAKKHRLSGKIICFEQTQNEKEIIVKSVFELEIREDAELHIEADTTFQGIGIRFHCPHCNESDFVSNLQKTGEVINCRSCNTAILKIDKPTEICQSMLGVNSHL